MEVPQKKPEMSIFPFSGIIEEIQKYQGDKPTLVVLYNGSNDMVFLNHNLDFKSQIMDTIMNHLLIEVMKAKGIQVEIAKKVE